MCLIWVNNEGTRVFIFELKWATFTGFIVQLPRPTSQIDTYQCNIYTMGDLVARAVDSIYLCILAGTPVRRGQSMKLLNAISSFIENICQHLKTKH